MAGTSDSFYDQYFKDDRVQVRKSDKEFYIIYLCHKYNEQRSKTIWARTAREAVSLFLAEDIKDFKHIKEVQEWISNSVQVKHIVKNNEVVNT